MSKNNFTPWTYSLGRKTTEGYEIYDIKSKELGDICEVGVFSSETKGVAALIAAAPDMYEALELAIFHLSGPATEISKEEFKFLTDVLKRATCG